MELIVIQENEREEVVLLDDEMQIVEPVYQFLKNQCRRGRAFNTIKADGRDLKVFYDFMQLSGYSVDEVTTDIILDYVDYLKSGDVSMLAIYKESCRTPKTINRMMSTVRSFYKFYETAYGGVNPILLEGVYGGGSKGMLAHIKNSNRVKSSIFKVKETKKRIHLIDEAEAEKFYMALPTRRDRLIFKILYLTGARIQEVLDLRIPQIPIPSNDKEICVLEGIKSKGKTRDLYVPMSVIRELDSFILEERGLVKTDHDFVFVANRGGYAGNRLSYHSLYVVYKGVSEKTGIELNFHDLRHSFISHLTEMGMDVSLVRIIAGHEQIATSQKYIHISGRYLKESLASYWRKSILNGGGEYE